MAGLTADLDFNFKWIRELATALPDFNGKYLSYIGSKARSTLYERYFKGQELNINPSLFPKNSRNQYIIYSDVNKRQTETKIYSPIMRFFETGRTLRDGTKEAGKYVITRKLKQDVTSGLPGYAKDFENRILQKELNKIEA
jgi:hypothetical protein